MRRVVFLFVSAVALAGWPAATGADRGEGRSPRGDEGIAAKYPGDVGMEKDPAVLLLEDFEDQPTVVNWMQEGGWFGGAGFGAGAGAQLTEEDPADGSYRPSDQRARCRAQIA